MNVETHKAHGIAYAIRTAADTGKVIFGSKETLTAIEKKGVKLVVVSSNCPQNSKDELMSRAKLAKIPVYEYGGTSLMLGSTCGKPFLVSMLGVVESGDSNVLELAGR